MQFATTGNPVTDWALSALCKRGAIATSVRMAGRQLQSCSVKWEPEGGLGSWNP